MKRHALLCAVGLLILMPRANAQKPFTLEQVMSAPLKGRDSRLGRLQNTARMTARSHRI